ncbi:DNA cytosine methyltransferase [Fusobacterium pseudoperiodonticum]
MKRINVIDLFAGCGGLSEGFMQTNRFNFLAHIEWEKAMVDTLRSNLINRWNYPEEKAKTNVIRFDIQKLEELFTGKLSMDSLEKYADNSKKFFDKGLDGVIGNSQVDLIIGGPPCQAYSLAGRAQDKFSMKNDYRNYLFESFVEVVDRYKPKFFIFENVPGILSAKPGDEYVIKRIFEAFKKIGYIIREPELLKKSIFSSMNYNVPQDRKRVIIFGVRNDYEVALELFYKNFETKKNDKILTVKDTISFLPKFIPLKKSYKLGSRNYSHKLVGDVSVDLHEPRYHNSRDISIFKKWLENNMNNYSNIDKLKFYKTETGRNTNHNKYRNLEWDKPSPTIVSHLYKDGLMFIHPDINQLRTITVREAALLQSFPIDYKFEGSMATCFKMIGNAVPVNFSKQIALTIFEIFKEIF